VSSFQLVGVLKDLVWNDLSQTRASHSAWSPLLHYIQELPGLETKDSDYIFTLHQRNNLLKNQMLFYKLAVFPPIL